MSKRTNSHTISHAENIFSGDAWQAGAEDSGRGIPRASLVQVDLGTPEVGDPNGVCESQNIGAAGNLSLNGADANSAGTVATFDVPRGVVVDSGGADSATLTIYGTDKYGVPIQEDIVLNGATAVFGLKAFKTITRVAASAQISNSAFVGDSDILGLPFRLENVADVVVINEDDNNLFGVVAQTAADPNAITGLVPESQNSQALTINSNNGAPNEIIADCRSPITAVGGSGASTQQETDINALFVLADANFDDLATLVNELTVESTDYKDTLDKIIADVLSIRNEVVKLVADSVAVDVGTLVKADATVTATATTGDVRGTYDPTTVLDGSKVIKLLLKPKGRNTRNAYGSVQYRA